MDKKVDFKIISEKNNDSHSWLKLSEDDLIRLSDVSVCMYGKQNSDIISDGTPGAI